MNLTKKLFTSLAVSAVITLSAGQIYAVTGDKPNILVIMGNDIGWFNPSVYNHGMMGYKTPNSYYIKRESNERLQVS